MGGGGGGKRKESKRTVEIGSTKLPRSGRTKLVCGMSCFFRVQLSLGQKKHLEFVIMSDIYIYIYIYVYCFFVHIVLAQSKTSIL